MKVVRYRVNLHEPVLVGGPEGDPNTAVSVSYLPGGTLRGALIKTYLRANSTSDLACDPTARRLFFDGRTRYLNGYPAAGAQRCLSTSLGWHHQKGNEIDLFDLTLGPAPQGAELKRPKAKFTFFTGDDVRFVGVKPTLRIHIRRNRQGMPGGRARRVEDDGDVYRYSAIAAGQLFEAAILCEDGDADSLAELLDGTCILGKSRNAGYGLASLSRVGSINDANKWRETGRQLTEDIDGKLVVTLASDAIVRNENGQIAADPAIVGRLVAGHLGLAAGALIPKETFAATTLTGGFNATWGLPLPQAQGVAMGSTFVFDHPGCDTDAIRRLELLGIGERRVEGFGRVVVNWNANWKLEAAPGEISSTVAVNPGEYVDIQSGSATWIADRIYRQRLEDMLVKRAGELARHVVKSAQGGPSRSQIARLRGILFDALQQHRAGRDVVKIRNRLRAYLEHLYDRKSARDQFERSNIAGKRLSEWLETRIDDKKNEIWDVLEGGDSRVPRIGETDASRTDDLAFELNLLLADAVLARAAKLKVSHD